jgi:uncharacterized repeat protein (TIGR01451 family)
LPDPDSTPDNNVPSEDDQASIRIPSVTADLSLDKTVDNTSPVLGDTVTFTVTLTNSGPDTATNIQIRDPIPAGLNNPVTRPERGTYANGIWSLSSLAPGASTQLRVTGDIVADSITNVAEVAAVDQDDPDSTPGNNNPNEDDQASATVGLSPGLALVKRITALAQDGSVTRFTNPVNNPISPSFVGEVTLPATAQVSSGDVVEYTIYYQASGATARNVQVCDAIPQGTVYLPGSIRLDPADTAANAIALTDGADGDPGQFLPPLTPAPAPCPNGMNPSGSVFVSVGDVPPSLPGFVRFNIQVP